MNFYHRKATKTILSMGTWTIDFVRNVYKPTKADGFIAFYNFPGKRTTHLESFDKVFRQNWFDSLTANARDKLHFLHVYDEKQTNTSLTVSIGTLLQRLLFTRETSKSNCNERKEKEKKNF